MYKPQSKITKNGVLHYLKNYKDIIQDKYSGIDAIASGLEALLLLDPKKYSKEIEYHKKYLIKLQRKNGSFHKEGYYIENDTAYALIALSKVLDLNNPTLIHGRNYLEKQLRKQSLYKKNPSHVYVPAVEALIALGGESASQLQKVTAELKSSKLQLLNSKPYFIETSPNKNVQSIRGKMIEMIDTAENEIFISSPHLDYYSEISSKARENQKLVVKIITRGIDDWQGEGKRFAVGALATLKKLNNVSIRIFGIIHARVLIVDSAKVLISSADFQRMQLYDEYNAGIYTEDPEVVLETKAFFMNAFDMSKELSKK